MKYHYIKDLKKRIFLKRIELKKLICLYLIFCNKISILEKYKLYINFFFSKKIKINFELKNHCILTKNTRTVNRFSALTRSNLKHLISWGMLNGMRKIIW